MGLFLGTGATDRCTTLPSARQQTITAGNRSLRGKRVAMVVLSGYPSDPRPQRAAAALANEGMSVDLVCLADGKSRRRETHNGIDVLRLPITHRRGGKLSYLWEYSACILASAAVLALRSLTHRYDLVYIHNMPDTLVLSSLIPKALGAKVILDMHDPMPELMMTIFKRDENSSSVRALRRLEKWSMACADRVLTVNVACQRIFAARSCASEKIGVVMNSPDGEVFPFLPARPLDPTRDTANRPFVVMYHGSLLERNGVDLAVDALARIRETVPAAQLRIYGASTPFLERVMQTVRERQLDGAVQHLGRKALKDIVRAIEECDVGVIPNHRNAFTEINTPTRIFEYLALGKPVIAPRTCGIQDYFDDGSLLFFEPGSSEDLAGRIAYAYSHPGDALRITERGQQVYLAHAWEREKETLVNLVDEVLQRRPR